MTPHFEVQIVHSFDETIMTMGLMRYILICMHEDLCKVYSLVQGKDGIQIQMSLSVQHILHMHASLGLI